MRILLCLYLVWVTAAAGFGQEKSTPKAPERSEGDGPYSKLIIRGVTLIDGTGSPPFGPVDIVIEQNLITQIKSVGSPGVPINLKNRPIANEGAREIDAEGMYVLPGLIDMHGHIGVMTRELQRNMSLNYGWDMGSRQ